MTSRATCKNVLQVATDAIIGERQGGDMFDLRLEMALAKQRCDNEAMVTGVGLRTEFSRGIWYAYWTEPPAEEGARPRFWGAVGAARTHEGAMLDLMGSLTKAGKDLASRGLDIEARQNPARSDSDE